MSGKPSSAGRSDDTNSQVFHEWNPFHPPKWTELTRGGLNTIARRNARKKASSIAQSPEKAC
jgi:hypothetical protein